MIHIHVHVHIHIVTIILEEESVLSFVLCLVHMYMREYTCTCAHIHVFTCTCMQLRKIQKTQTVNGCYIRTCIMYHVRKLITLVFGGGFSAAFLRRSVNSALISIWSLLVSVQSK